MATLRQVVTFEGVSEKQIPGLKEMLRLDIAEYPSRYPMAGASVSDVKEPNRGKCAPSKPKP